MTYNLRKRSIDDENTYDHTNTKKLKTLEISEDSSSTDDSFIDDLEDNRINTFIDNIHSELKKYKVPRDILEQIIQTNILKLADVCSDEYFEKSKEWKTNLSEEEIKRLEPQFETITQELVDEQPNVAKILDANLTQLEKKRCLQLLDIMNSHEPGSSEFYEVNAQLIDILEKAKLKTKLDVQKLEKEEDRLKKIILDNYTLKDRILNLKAPDDTKSIIYSKYLKLEHLDISDSEYSTLKSWLEWAASLPYNKIIKLKTDDMYNFFTDVQKKLDTHLYGLKNIKQQLLLLLNNSLTSKKARKAIALCGPPGTGKTSIARAFAKSVGLPFDSISLGGMCDSTFLNGSDNVYVGATPSIIVKILKKMKYSNGIVQFDEVDKVPLDIQYALLHITDFIQNQEFCDKFLSEIKIDISKLWFFYSMNDENVIDKALKDRLPIIRVGSYNFHEKINIVKNYILPEELELVGMKSSDVIFTEEAARNIAYYNRNEFQNEGIRPIKNIVEDIVSKINFYRNVITCSNDATCTDKIDLDFKIENFSLPFTLTSTILKDILSDNNNITNLDYFI